MVGPALCAAAPEAMVSISNEMAAALRIKERTFIRLARAPLCLGHYIIREGHAGRVPAAMGQGPRVPHQLAPQLFSISFPSSAASFSVSASLSFSPRCLFTARA